MVQRRADAFDALSAGADRLTCECDKARLHSRRQSRECCRHVTSSPTRPPSKVLAGNTPGYTVDPDELFPADLVAELSKTAKLVPVVHPGDEPAECG